MRERWRLHEYPRSHHGRGRRVHLHMPARLLRLKLHVYDRATAAGTLSLTTSHAPLFFLSRAFCQTLYVLDCCCCFNMQCMDDAAWRHAIESSYSRPNPTGTRCSNVNSRCAELNGQCADCRHTDDHTRVAATDACRASCTDCLQTYDSCWTEPCKNGGVCNNVPGVITGDGAYTCTCPVGFCTEFENCATADTLDPSLPQCPVSLSLSPRPSAPLPSALFARRAFFFSPQWLCNAVQR
jgi:hypothetical protein